MKHKMIKKNRQLTSEETMKILINGEYGVLSTVSEELQPYGVPLSYAILNDALYFHCAMVGHKLNNIKNNTKVCFTVVGDTCPVMEPENFNFSTYYESVIVFGQVTEINSEREKVDVLRVLCKKYLNEHMHHFEHAINRSIKGTKVFKISIDKITGKAKKQIP
ncbi:MAG: pyridoxamine 5'-phosphate oxidase family protein [Bacilli bacterium]